jgi:hypothetical protein
VQRLPVQVRLGDGVVVDDREDADPRRREQRQHRTAQPAGPDHEYVRAREGSLAVDAESREDPLPSEVRRRGIEGHVSILPAGTPTRRVGGDVVLAAATGMIPVHNSGDQRHPLRFL